MAFSPSKYQKAIFKYFKETVFDLLISAVAGSGKTTTLLKLIELIQDISPDKTAMYVAFNKHIAEELKTKISPSKNLTISTLHGRGYKALSIAKRGGLELSDWKTFNICKELSDTWKDIAKNKRYTKLYQISEFWNLYRLTYQKNLDNFFDIVDKYGLSLTKDDINKVEQVIYTMNLYNKAYQSKNPFLIDFVDMIYLPIYLNLSTLEKVDILLIDEAQDLSTLQHEFINRMLKEGGRRIYVGDPYQAIYGFSGSDVESWKKLKDIPNIIELPLSFCYRCGKKIVAVANGVHNIMESPEWQHDGVVMDKGTLFDVFGAKPNDLIICRNTKPLLQLYFNFISNEKTCYIKGSDIGRGLITVLKGFRSVDVKNLIFEMQSELSIIYDKLKENGVSQPLKNQKYLQYEEKIEIVKLFAKKYSTTKEIIDVIGKIFKDVGNGITLSTVHKSKGLEYDNVYFYLPQLIPNKFATAPWELEQEANLLYVGITRAKNNLTFVREELVN